MSFDLRMTDAIELLGLPYPEYGKSSYNIPCPCCDDKPNGKHLNINLRKNVFNCPRCHDNNRTYGGVLALYSLYTGVSIEEAGKAMRKRIKTSPSYVPKRNVQVDTCENAEEVPLIDVDARHATYSALLGRLTLASDHRQNLLNRGLTEREIVGLQCKTTPVAGMTVIAKQLHEQGLYLAGVPGFYRARNDSWTFASNRRGFLVPVRDMEGCIQGLQVRLDNETERKYRWVSSTDMKDGTKAESFVHFAGRVESCMLLTEGALKADIIHALSGASVLAIAGVNATKKLKQTLVECKIRGLKKIKIAFDMDFVVNPHVAQARKKLLELLDEMEIDGSTYIWDGKYKGLDDYIWKRKFQSKR